MELNKMPNATEFQTINNFIWDTKKSLEKNGDPELVAVMKEFCDKSDELQECIKSGKESNEIVEKLIEVEQAADSALKAAKANNDQDMLEKIQESHDRVKQFKERYLS